MIESSELRDGFDLSIFHVGLTGGMDKDLAGQGL
jgi:hypothetical protein